MTHLYHSSINHAVVHKAVLHPQRCGRLWLPI